MLLKASFKVRKEGKDYIFSMYKVPRKNKEAKEGKEVKEIKSLKKKNKLSVYFFKKKKFTKKMIRKFP